MFMFRIHSYPKTQDILSNDGIFGGIFKIQEIENQSK
jgi:hypothetical protein